MEVTGKDEVHDAVLRLAKQRHLPGRTANGKRWPMSVLLPRGYRLRLADHMCTIKRSGSGGDSSGEAYFPIDQSACHSARSYEVMPTLLRGSRIWSTDQDRLLLVSEHCRVMGLKWSDMLASMREHKIRAIAGNAMCQPAICSVLLYLFAFTVNV